MKGVFLKLQYEEISKLFQELDQRYITKDELFMLTDGRYAKRDEFAELRGKVEAVQTMQAKSADLLEDIHSTTTKIREENAIQTAKLEATGEELKALKKSAFTRFVLSNDPLPRVFRFSFMMFFQLMVLYVISIFNSDLMDVFIKNNGLYVTMFSVATATLASWKGGKNG